MRIDLLFILGKYQLRASFIDRVLAVLLKNIQKTLYMRILSPHKPHPRVFQNRFKIF